MSPKQQGRNERCNCGSGKKYKYCHGSINYNAGVTKEPNHVVTQTELKLRDAETQLRLANENNADEDTVRSCINCVIASGRSITFVMQKESGGDGPLREWYEARMTSLLASSHSVLIKFFNANRVHTIHRGVVAQELVKAQVTDYLIDGVSQPGFAGRALFLYKFTDTRGLAPGDSGGVFRLCRSYLDVMGALVNEWLVERARLLTVPTGDAK